MINLFWHKTNNFGDAVSPEIVKHFTGLAVKFAAAGVVGKMVSTGSVLHAVRAGDTVWGTGAIFPKNQSMPDGVKCLALRGPLTAKLCGAKCKVFGDPALLLPFIYSPQITKAYKIGFVPHYADKQLFAENRSVPGIQRIIDIQAPWKTVIDEIFSCEVIVSSSLHGVIAAEAYGIPAIWAKWSDNIIGGEFKFQDYFNGTGRPDQRPFFPITPIGSVVEIQRRLLAALKERI